MANLAFERIEEEELLRLLQRPATSPNRDIQGIAQPGTSCRDVWLTAKGLEVYSTTFGGEWSPVYHDTVVYELTAAQRELALKALAPLGRVREG